MSVAPLPLPKRHVRLSSSERRLQIVETAMRLFAEKGFRGVTTRELAAEVGVSEPVLYMHFETKRDLYSAILEALAIGPTQLGQKSFSQSANDRDFFLNLGQGILAWHTADPNRSRLLLFSALEGHELAELFHTRQISTFFDTLAAHIRSRIDAGAFRPTDPLITARAFCGMIGSYAQRITIFKCPDSPEIQQQTLEKMVDLFLQGIQQVPAFAVQSAHS